MGMQQLQIVGFGAQNINIYDHALGDWSGETGLMWLFFGCAMVMFIYSLYNAFLISQQAVADVESHKPMRFE